MGCNICFVQKTLISFIASILEEKYSYQHNTTQLTNVIVNAPLIVTMTRANISVIIFCNNYSSIRLFMLFMLFIKIV